MKADETIQRNEQYMETDIACLAIWSVAALFRWRMGSPDILLASEPPEAMALHRQIASRQSHERLPKAGRHRSRAITKPALKFAAEL
jgi:hypothetical protein